MIFTITKSSTWNEEEDSPPCPEAYWQEKRWLINVETLEQLVEIAKSAGTDLVIGRGTTPSIEIYDDYRE